MNNADNFSSVEKDMDVFHHQSSKEGVQSEQDKLCYQNFLDGNMESFEELVINHKDRLIYFIHRLVNNMTIAEDLAQDAFVEVLIHKERYHFKVSFKTYLFTIGRNKAIDYIRKNKRMMLVEEYPESFDEENRMEENLIRKEENKLLYHAMKKLKPDYKAAISLIDIEGMTYAEAAKVLKKNDAQMKVLIHRARKSLAKLMEKEGYSYENK
jgi:RNA polymerase sigma-70 factor (ECF subfamily)